MLVSFSSRFGRLTLLGESAVRLLRLAGHSGTVPGAVLAADVPAFLDRLRAGLERHGDELSPPPAPASAGDDGEEREHERPASVSLRKRAVPLLELLETARARQSDVLWEPGA